MRSDARTPAQTDLLRRLFDDIVATALKGPVQYIQNEDKTPIFTHVPTHAGRRPAFDGRRSLIDRYGLLAFPAELWLELNRIAP